MKTNMFLKLKIISFNMILVSLMLIGCGSEAESNTAGAVDTPSQTPDTAFVDISEKEPDGDYEAPVQNQEEDTISDDGSKYQELEPTLGDNGSMEIYAARETISLSDDMIVGQVALEDILEGKPILYDRVIIDGFVVEWILSDYEDEKSTLIEEGVLVISKENDAENTQVIRVQGRGGGWGPPAGLANKFEYMDVNFDDVPDLLICTGHHGNQGAITYYCFLQTDTGFVEAPTFTDIVNPSVDTENQLILSQWRNWAASHSWAEYKYQDNSYVLYRELCEEAEIPEKGQEANEDIWVWTVNGEEIGRSDKLSESEIEDLLYNENSEWRITDDRWRTIYNNGLTADFSIYNEP